MSVASWDQGVIGPLAGGAAGGDDALGARGRDGGSLFGLPRVGRGSVAHIKGGPELLRPPGAARVCPGPTWPHRPPRRDPGLGAPRLHSGGWTHGAPA